MSDILHRKINNFTKRAIESARLSELFADSRTEYSQTLDDTASTATAVPRVDVGGVQAMADKHQIWVTRLNRWRFTEKTNVPVVDPEFQKISWLCGFAHDILPDLIGEGQYTVDWIKRALTGEHTSWQEHDTVEGMQQSLTQDQAELAELEQLYKDVREYVSSRYSP